MREWASTNNTRLRLGPLADSINNGSCCRVIDSQWCQSLSKGKYLQMPTKGSRTSHSDNDPAMRAPVPEASKHGSTHCDSVKAAGGGWLKVVRGRWQRRRYRA